MTSGLDAIPRMTLARLPTPLHGAPDFRDALGGEAKCPRILLKRDDLTDLAMGGNKARKLEFLVADASQAGATVLLTTGAVQSNHARMTAAAAGRAGMRAVLVVTGDPPEQDIQGNLLLFRILGAEVHVIRGGDDAAAASREASKIAELLDRLEREGERPVLIPLGGSNAIGALGYVDAAREMKSQLDEMGESPARIYYASGSRGTQAGLELGTRLYELDWQCIGVAVSGGEAEKRERAVRIANEAAALIGSDIRVNTGDMRTEQDQIGEGYGMPTAACIDAIRLLARTEAILLDPVYTGKAMAGMIDHIRTGDISPADTVVFLHTGGVPGLFGHARRVAPMFRESPP